MTSSCREQPDALEHLSPVHVLINAMKSESLKTLMADKFDNILSLDCDVWGVPYQPVVWLGTVALLWIEERGTG
jgi:hypothetical protein